MKRVISILFILAIILSLCACSKVKINSDSDVTLAFIYGDKNINTTLTKEESEKVIDILDGSSYSPRFSGTPSCGFSKDISLKVGGKIFAIANDTCNQVKDMKNLKFFSIPKEDMDYIHSLFESYGGHFPCV